MYFLIFYGLLVKVKFVNIFLYLSLVDYSFFFQLNNINMLPNPQFASPNQIIKLQPNPIPTSIENDNKEE